MLALNLAFYWSSTAGVTQHEACQKTEDKLLYCQFCNLILRIFYITGE
jgi:hypothetical protein